MTSETIFYLIVGILIADFVFEKILDALNAKHFKDPVPQGLQDIYKPEEYEKSVRYKTEKFRFGLLSSSISFFALLAFLFLDGFEFVDELARSVSDNQILIGLIFFGILMLVADILSLPFSYYSTFVIEEKYGFNKTSKKTFWTDKLKSWGMMIILGGGILALIIWFYNLTGDNFWIYAWALTAAFSILLNMFYAKLIVPLFNKQEPLPNNSLREKIEAYAKQVGFKLDNIFVIDGSKRSTKANAYFSGLGKEKRITLYDTLINDLEEDEIVAVLAHEVGHYKRKHIIINLCAGIISTGFTLWLLSLFVDEPAFSLALGITVPSFHVGLVVFGILYSPISEITGLLMNWLSRKFEYQADDFAKHSFSADALINALKKLSASSLSNLTPHPAYVFFNYSHPPLFQRMKNLQA